LLLTKAKALTNSQNTEKFSPSFHVNCKALPEYQCDISAILFMPLFFPLNEPEKITPLRNTLMKLSNYCSTSPSPLEMEVLPSIKKKNTANEFILKAKGIWEQSAALHSR